MWPDDQIVVLNGEEEVDVVFRWELARFQEQGGLLSWNANVDMDKLTDQHGQVWALKWPARSATLSAIPPVAGAIASHLDAQPTRFPYTIAAAGRRIPAHALRGLPLGLPRNPRIAHGPRRRVLLAVTE